MALTKVSTGLISADLASVDLNIDANTLYIDVTNNRVGINNTGPATALDVTGTVSADGATLALGSIINFSDRGNLTHNASTYDMTFNTNSLANALVIKGTGEVGIGVTPSVQLHLQDGASEDVSGSTIRMDLSGINPYWEIQARNGGNSANRKLHFYTSSGSDEVLTLTQAGNVGIGTVSPSYSLDVDQVGTNSTGTFLLTGGNSASNDYTQTALLKLRGTSINPNQPSHDANSSVAEIRLNHTDLAGDASSGNITFHTNPSNNINGSLAERMRIDDVGNVLVGRTSRLANQTESISSDTVMSVHGVLTSHQTDCGVMQYVGDAMQIRAYGATAGTGNIQFKVGGGGGSADFEAARIDSSGNLLVGTTGNNPSANGAGGDAGVAVSGSGYISAARSSEAVALFNRMDSDGDIVLFRRDGTTVGSISVAAGNRLAISGTSGGTGSGIYFGNTGIVPTDHTGAVSDNTEDMGNSSYRFKDAYITNGVTTGSDANDKQDIETLSDAEQRVAVACKGLLRKWRWKDAVEAKGDEARIHFGIIAQDLQAAFEAEGLDSGRYAMFMSNTWTDEETGEERTRLGVRYHELLAFIIAAI